MAGSRIASHGQIALLTLSLPELLITAKSIHRWCFKTQKLDNTKGRLQKKKPDLRTLSQKVGGGPDQIPNFVVCEIGTRGGEGSQTLICPNFKSDLRTKGDL